MVIDIIKQCSSNKQSSLPAAAQ